jgi:hypothetical protein
VITLVEDQHASEISLQTMGGALALADWYVHEAWRLQKAGRTDPRLLRLLQILFCELRLNWFCFSFG